MIRLQDILIHAEGDAPAPVERWDPPYCGDIGLEILSDGTWLYQGSPIRRPAMVKLFARVLRRDADGRTYLVTPAEKIAITVKDAPFLAVALEVAGTGFEQVLAFRTNVDDVVRCGADHPLRFGRGGADAPFKPYVHVRGRLDALVSRALAYDLAELAAPGPDGKGLGIWSDGAFFALPD